MTVCLTGDVHHMSLETRDQGYLDCTEVEAAIEYAEIAGKYDVPVTLFVTGKAAREEPERVKRLAAMGHVEIGGHNYWAFTTPVHSTWRALDKITCGRIGSWNGPRRFQAYEIKKTVEVFADIDINIRCWRDHAYRHDRHTADLLPRYGVTYFSDNVDPSGRVHEANGVTVVPINTPPDHEHVYHSFRTAESDAVADFEGPFGTEAREANVWCDWVLDYITDHVERDQLATVLAHPACMQIADRFEAFERLCERVTRKSRTVRMSEIEV